MDQAIQSRLKALGKCIGEATMSSGSRANAIWCMEHLPSLYDKLRQTNESRYGDEITRLVRGLLKQLAGETSCPEAQKLGTTIGERLRSLHEQLGLPTLNFELVVKAAPRARKAS